MIGMLAIDLDRTLLHTDKTISQYSADIIRRCRERGIRVVFATARPIRTVVLFLDQVECDAVIYHNGAFILAEGKRVGESYSIPPGEVRRILSYLQARYAGKKLSVEIDDTLYANFDVKEFWRYTSAVVTDFSDLPEMDADKIIVEIAAPQEYEEVLSLLPGELYGEMSDGKLCLVMNKNATKLNAVRRLSAIWNIPLSDIVAFGDDYNDIGMIRHCGVGVAMGNAIPEALAAADAVTDSNDDDGVARYIERCIFT
jgi:Cof subfamily protein (haloacid dehalogenase superfamily)